MKKTYTTELWGDKYKVSGDFANAAAPVFFDGNPTQYQTADFRHDPADAMRTYLQEVAAESGDDVEDVTDAIEAAVEEMQ